MRSYKMITAATITGALLLSGTQMMRAQVNPATQSSTEAQRGQLSKSDYQFLEKATRGGMEEVELGQLAEQKGTSEAVRSFGQRMVTDHTKLNNELKQIASQKGAVLPTQMSSKENSTLQHLQTLTGADFDKTYAKSMVKDHRTDLKEFQTAAQKVSDPDLRAFAQKGVSTLQEHLGMAENLETSTKAEK